MSTPTRKSESHFVVLLSFEPPYTTCNTVKCQPWTVFAQLRTLVGFLQSACIRDADGRLDNGCCTLSAIIVEELSSFFPDFPDFLDFWILYQDTIRNVLSPFVTEENFIRNVSHSSCLSKITGKIWKKQALRENKIWKMWKFRPKLSSIITGSQTVRAIKIPTPPFAARYLVCSNVPLRCPSHIFRVSCGMCGAIYKERRHSAPTGRFGDSKFAELVFVRPKLLHSIISQGYAALWSDSDMVWLDDPLPLLPRLDNTTGVSFDVRRFYFFQEK